MRFDAFCLCAVAAGWLLTVGAGSLRGEPAKAPAPKPLNNLVTELLEVKTVGPDGAAFINPRDGWVFFRCQAAAGQGGSVAVILHRGDDEEEIIRQGSDGPSTPEAMRCLPKGDYRVTLTVSGQGTSIAALTVRAIPEIIYANYPSNPILKEYGTYDWQFLKRIGMLDNINVIIGSPEGAELAEWQRQGKRLIEQKQAVGLSGPTPTVEQCYKTWIEAAGMNDPKFSGIIIDEFYPSVAAKYPVWVEALQRVMKEKPDRWVYPYIAGDPAGLLPFVKPLSESPNCRFAYERYLKEQPTEAQAWQYKDRLKGDLQVLAKEAPDIRKKTICVLGLLCGPPETLNADPAVNFKVFMDMQFHVLANEPGLDGLYGIEEYLTSYSDEEYLRWAPRLYRHYCIEGRKERLLNEPYMLTHIRNPDFEAGLEGWTVTPAAEGSVATGSLDGLGWLEGRWPRDPKGDKYLSTKRSAERPNVISQEVRDLQPGRAYSLKLYAGDIGELTKQQKLAIGVKVDGVELIPEKCFHAVYANCYDHHINKYGKQNTYFNFIRLVFRAKDPTARLTISDWASEQAPGGPAGQEIFYNFVEVEPYLLD